MRPKHTASDNFVAGIKPIVRWRVVATTLTVLAPLALFMKLSDDYSKLLLPEDAKIDVTPLTNLKLLGMPEFALADWSGQLNYVGLTIFLAALCSSIVALNVVIIIITLRSYDDFKSKSGYKWLSLARTTTLCIVFLLVASIGGIAFGWNGSAYDNTQKHPCPGFTGSTIIAGKNNGRLNWIDRVGELVFGKDAASETIASQKSGSDFIREATISALFCKIESAPGASFSTEPRSSIAWNILNFNTVLIYATSILCFMTVALLGLFTGRTALFARGPRLKILLIALTSLMSVGVAQLKAYFNWPIGMLDIAPAKHFAALADASANYTGLVGSATLFAAFVFPLLLWQHDVTHDVGSIDAEKYASEFRLPDVLSFVALFAAPAFSSSLIKLISGGH